MSLTVLETLSHTLFNLYTELFIRAEVISKTVLKLCMQRQMSATAAHFSMAAARADDVFWRRISEATNLLTYGKEKLKRNTEQLSHEYSWLLWKKILHNFILLCVVNLKDKRTNPIVF